MAIRILKSGRKCRGENCGGLKGERGGTAFPHDHSIKVKNLQFNTVFRDFVNPALGENHETSSA